MVDGQLMPAVEQLRQRLPATGSVENIILLDRLPGQLPTLLAQLVTEARKLLLIGKQLPACGEPVVV